MDKTESLHSIMKDGFIELTLGDWLSRVARFYPDNAAVVNVARGVRLTYAQLDARAREVAKGLLSIGVKKGDKVAIWATNYPEWLYLLFGCAKIGAILVTVNTNYKVFELEYLLSQSDTMSLFFIKGHKDTDYVSIVKELTGAGSGKNTLGMNCSRLPLLKNIVYIPHDESDAVPQGFTSWQDVLNLGNSVGDGEYEAVEKSLDRNEVINMQYTSGTTGFPKGVMLIHRNILNNGYYIGENMKLTPKDRLYTCALSLLWLVL